MNISRLRSSIEERGVDRSRNYGVVEADAALARDRNVS
jgi:hypothetical protein